MGALSNDVSTSKTGQEPMKREYNTGSSDICVMFTGKEIEHTPAHNMDTLFVVGIEPLDDIIAYAEKMNVNHIYLGANMSFLPDDQWDTLVLPLLKKGYWVTLDFDIKWIEWVLESGYTEYNQFIPMISAKLPYIGLLGYNACLKLDDKDFDATNPGVWVHRVHELMNKDCFTNWQQYNNDMPLELK